MKGEGQTARGVGGVMVSIVAFQAVDPGSIPGQRRRPFFLSLVPAFASCQDCFDEGRPFEFCFLAFPTKALRQTGAQLIDVGCPQSTCNQANSINFGTIAKKFADSKPSETSRISFF